MTTSTKKNAGLQMRLMLADAYRASAALLASMDQANVEADYAGMRAIMREIDERHDLALALYRALQDMGEATPCAEVNLNSIKMCLEDAFDMAYREYYD